MNDRKQRMRDVRWGRGKSDREWKASGVELANGNGNEKLCFSFCVLSKPLVNCFPCILIFQIRWLHCPHIFILDLFHFSHHLFSSSGLIIIVICWASQLLPWRYEWVSVCLWVLSACEHFESSVRHSYIHCWKSRKWTHVPPKLYCLRSSCVRVHDSCHSLSLYCHSLISLSTPCLCSAYAMSFHKFFDAKCGRINLQISSSN